jgi:uncharacterized membrane protein YhhN
LTPAESALLAGLALLVALHVVAERRDARWRWATKAGASLCFVALGFLARASAPVLVALVLALAGDLLLVPRGSPRALRAGIVAFLLAHVALLAAFALRAPDLGWGAASLVALGAIGILVARALWTRVPPTLRGPVAAYVAVVTLMVAGAAAAAGGAGPRWLAVPALAFWANDLLVARDRFVERRAWHRAVGLPLYYGAMAAFALSGA